MNLAFSMIKPWI